MNTWTAVTYPQDFSEGGLGLGPETILRLEGIVEAHASGKYLIENIVLAGGFGPDVHEYPHQKKTFAHLMDEWLVNKGTFVKEHIHRSHNLRVWNCMEVTLEMLNIIRAKKLSHRLLVVSAGFHIYPRMWCTWKILCPASEGWELAFLPLWSGKYDPAHELLGTCKYIPLALWHRLSHSNLR